MRRRPPRRIRGIIYLPEYREKNWRKHHVSEQDVVDVFADRPLFRFQERGLRKSEDVYAAYGQVPGGRYLIVFFVHKLSGEALVLSVREMTTAERHYYATNKTHRLHQD